MILNRQPGKKYLGKKKEAGKWNYNIPKKEKNIKPRCKCVSNKKSSLKCSQLEKKDRLAIFNDFWSMTWNEKKIFVDTLRQMVPINRKRDRHNNTISRRNNSFMYFLLKDDKHIKVCKTMFCNTLGVSLRTIHGWKKRSTKSNQNKETNPISNKKKESKNVEEFLNVLPKMESHYCRASSSRLYLQPEWTSATQLYEFYTKNWCVNKNVSPMSIYTFHIALKNMNISLYHPKKDQCELCACYSQGNVNELEYKEHIKKKEEARTEKSKDKINENFMYTMDLQSVLLSPRSQV